MPPVNISDIPSTLAGAAAPEGTEEAACFLVRAFIGAPKPYLAAAAPAGARFRRGFHPCFCDCIQVLWTATVGLWAGQGVCPRTGPRENGLQQAACTPRQRATVLRHLIEQPIAT